MAKSGRSDFKFHIIIIKKAQPVKMANGQQHAEVEIPLWHVRYQQLNIFCSEPWSLKISQDPRFLLKVDSDKNELCDVGKGGECKMDRTKPCYFRYEGDPRIRKAEPKSFCSEAGDKAGDCVDVSAYDVTFELQEKLINAENFMFRVRPRAEQNTEERYGEWSQKSSQLEACSF